MPQDAYTIGFIADELQGLLKGGKISKIAQPEKDLLAFIIYTGKSSVKLEICLSAKGCRINIADGETVAPKTAPAFCMLLRKYLQNAQIVSVGQIDCERIVYIDFLCTSEFERTQMRLYAELMGKYSNAVLTKDGVITRALKTTALTDSVKRILFNGARYALPEKQDKTAPGNVEALKKTLENISGDAAAYIADRVLGISYATALDIVETYGEKVSAEEINSYICGGLRAPCVVFTNGEPSDFKVRSADKNALGFNSVTEAQTYYYAYVTAKREFTDSKRKCEAALSSAIKKCEKRLANIQARLHDCRDMETVRLKGELITANIYAVKKGDEFYEAYNYYDEAGGKIKIALDKTLSPADNAQKYFKRYAKLKRTFTAVSEQKKDEENALNYLESIRAHLNAAENTGDLKETEDELRLLNLIKTPAADRKKDKTTPFREYEKDGYKIIAGRNNISNDRLLKSISADDLWLHAQGYHSSHVAVLSNGKAVPDAVLSAAAEICAYYSAGRGASKVAVDCCARRLVKKPPKANAGFVIYSGYSTVLVKPDAHTELLRLN